MRKRLFRGSKVDWEGPRADRIDTIARPRGAAHGSEGPCLGTATRGGGATKLRNFREIGGTTGCGDGDRACEAPVSRVGAGARADHFLSVEVNGFEKLKDKSFPI